MRGTGNANSEAAMTSQFTQNNRAGIAFPNVASFFGGAQRVEYTARFAWITTADGRTVCVPRSKLLPVDKWSAFYLADAANAAR
jgi:hypothetical protein